MAYYEELMRRVVASSQMEPYEMDEFVLEMQQMKANLNRLNRIVDDYGGLKPEVFLGKFFTVLPHETGTLYKTVAQAISSGAAFESITWNEASTLTVVNGMTFTPATDPTHFVVPGGKSATYLITARVKWEGHATGVRSLLLVTNEANRFQASEYPPDANVFQMEWSFVYHSVAEEIQFGLKAAQTSGVALDIQANNCYFSAVRLR